MTPLAPWRPNDGKPQWDSPGLGKGERVVGTKPEVTQTPKLSLSVSYLLLVLPGAVHHLLGGGCAGWLEILPAWPPPAPAPGPGAEESLGEF